MTGRWTIGGRLKAGFMSVTVVTLLLGVVGFWGARSGATAVGRIGETLMPSVDCLSQVQQAATATRVAQRTLLMPGLSHADRSRQYENIDGARQAASAAIARFESLEQTAEVAAAWGEFEPAWAAWCVASDRFLELVKSIDGADVLNPPALGRELERFRGDHYLGTTRLLTMLQTGIAYEGGTDDTACGFGKWLRTFQSSNPALVSVQQTAGEAHQAFHQGVAHVKELVIGGAGGAAEAYQADVVTPMEGVFAQLDRARAEVERVTEEAQAAERLLLNDVRTAQVAAFAALDRIVELSRRGAATETAGAVAAARIMTWSSAVAAVAGLLLAVVLGMLLTGGIKRALGRISTQLSEGAEQVNDAAAQVANAAQTLAAGASEQASSLEESSSSLEELSAMTRRNAEGSRTASGLAGKAQESASRGSKTIGELNGAMQAINESAAQINQIIKVIEGIAFQTNLLALNAAVEAARAGEHGKGFAVVADEVRALAVRAAEAARETTVLIEASVERAKDGSRAAEGAGTLLQSIMGDVGQVAELLSGISSASDEQAQGVEQITSAVSQMDKVTQDNAAGAEESASAAEELSSQAQTVRGMVDELMVLVGGSRG